MYKPLTQTNKWGPPLDDRPARPFSDVEDGTELDGRGAGWAAARRRGRTEGKTVPYRVALEQHVTCSCLLYVGF
ncbi:hypothetical protein Hanom_Chr10g00948781 [Helianthus anomalus]